MRCGVSMTLALLGVLSMPAAAEESVGKAAFNRHCVHCHSNDIEASGTLQLARTRGQHLALLTGRENLVPAYVGFVVRNGLNAMPSFLPSELTDEQLKALIAYLAE